MPEFLQVPDFKFRYRYKSNIPLTLVVTSRAVERQVRPLAKRSRRLYTDQSLEFAVHLVSRTRIGDTSCPSHRK